MGRRNYHSFFNQLMYRILRYEGHIYFITLTFKDDCNLNRFTINNFIHKLEYRGVSVEGYFWVKELQKRGVVHYHMILLTPGKIVDFYSKVNESWGLGFVFVRGVEKTKIRNAVLYVMKYIKKDINKVENENNKMRRRMGRGGLLRFRVVSFYERVAELSEFEFVGSLVYKGVRFKVYRFSCLVMVLSLSMWGSGIDIFEIDVDKIIAKFKYRKKWNYLARILDDVQYSFLSGDERMEIIGYHMFDREINALLKSC